MEAMERAVPGSIREYTIPLTGDGDIVETVVASEVDEDEWYVSYLRIEAVGDGRLEAVVRYQERFDGPFAAGREFGELEQHTPLKNMKRVPDDPIDRKSYERERKRSLKSLMRWEVVTELFPDMDPEEIRRRGLDRPPEERGS